MAEWLLNDNLLFSFDSFHFLKNSPAPKINHLDGRGVSLHVAGFLLLASLCWFLSRPDMVRF